jgi:hypothetical protein
MGDLIDAVERELRPAAPTKITAALGRFRKRLAARPSRRSFERDLEAFLQSSSRLRAAAERHIDKIAPQIIQAATATMLRALATLAHAPIPQGRAMARAQARRAVAALTHSPNPQGADGRQRSRSGRVRRSGPLPPAAHPECSAQRLQ